MTVAEARLDLREPPESPAGVASGKHLVTTRCLSCRDEAEVTKLSLKAMGHSCCTIHGYIYIYIDMDYLLLWDVYNGIYHNHNSWFSSNSQAKSTYNGIFQAKSTRGIHVMHGDVPALI